MLCVAVLEAEDLLVRSSVVQSIGTPTCKREHGFQDDVLVIQRAHRPLLTVQEPAHELDLQSFDCHYALLTWTRERAPRRVPTG